MSTDYTRQIARFAVESKPSDVPAEIRHETTRALVNWIGNPISACHLDTVERAYAAIAPFSGVQQARLLGRGERLDTFKAAFLNCIASCIYDFDDTHLATVIHPTGPIASSLLALSERQQISGEAFLHALMLGIEVQCRLANALGTAPASIDDGWFLTGLTSPVGAAIATGRILGLNEQQMVWAIGNAAARAAGTREAHGWMVKNLVPPWGAEWGMQAAFLAQQDFTTSDAPLEGVRGLGALYARKTNFEALTEGLGSHWEITQNAFKPYPAGIVMHGAITAGEDVGSAPGFDASAVERVDLVVHPLCLKLTGIKKPKNAAEGTFSTYHWVAVALLNGRVSISQFSDACIADPNLVALRDRIEATEDDSLAKDGAHIRVTLKDGRVIEHKVDHALGSVERPLSDDALTAKLHDLADPVIGAAAASVLAERCWGIAGSADASTIVAAACGDVS